MGCGESQHQGYYFGWRERRYPRRPKANAMAVKPPATTTRLQGRFALSCMGAPPVSGKPATGVFSGASVSAGASVAVDVGASRQTGLVMLLSSRVTVAASSPKNRPARFAFVCMALTPVCDTTVPMNELSVPRVVELPTLHQMSQGSPPTTDEPDPVMSVVSALKM